MVGGFFDEREYSGADWLRMKSSSISLNLGMKKKLKQIIHKNYIISILRLNLGYMVKYNPLPSGVCLGFALVNSLKRAIFDRVSIIPLSQYVYRIHRIQSRMYSVHYTV